MRNFTKLSHVWSVLCHALLLAGIGLSALSAVSCRTQKSVERTTIRCDTLSQVRTEYEILTTEVQTVPGDSVSMTIPIDVIQNLPDGATFTQKNGRTRVSLKRQGVALVAEAMSDSIGRMATHYERRARDSLHCAGQSATEKEAVRTKPQSRITMLLGLVAVIMTATAIIKRR